MSSYQALLKVELSKGQFEDEFAVCGLDFRGQEFSLFVGKDFVVDDQIRVLVVEEEGDLALVRLPAKTFDNGATVTVKKPQISALQQA